MKPIQVYNWPSTKKLYVGKSGCGKTTLFWEHFLGERARVKFIFDHKAMEFSLRFGNRPIFDADDLMDATERGGTVCFSPAKMFPGEPVRGFEFFCEFVFAACEKIRGRKLLVVDELQKLVTTKSQPKPLLQICDIGRTFQIDCFFMASASNAIHNLVLGQVTECFAFMHGGKNSCEWETDFGFNAGEISCWDEKENPNGLKKGEYIWRNDAGETRRGGQAFSDPKK